MPTKIVITIVPIDGNRHTLATTINHTLLYYYRQYNYDCDMLRVKTL